MSSPSLLYAARVPVAIVLSVALAISIVMLESLESARFIGAIILLVTTSIGAVWLHARRTGDLMSPLTLSALFYILTFVGGAIYYWFTPRLPGFNSQYVGDRDFLPGAVVLGTVAWLAFVSGWFLNPFRRIVRHIPTVPSMADIRSPWPVIGLLLVVGWFARMIVLASGRYFHTPEAELGSSGSSWITIATAFLPLLAMAFTGAYAYFGPPEGPRRTARKVFFVLFAIELAWAAPIGERGLLVSLALIFTAIRYYGSGKMPWRLIAVASVLLGLVVFPFVNAYRDKGYQSNVRAHVEAAEQETLRPESTGSLLEQGANATFSRFSGVTSIAMIVASDRAYFTLAPGETLSWLPLSAIPRAIYPEKPDPGLFGNEFGRSHGIIASRDYITAITPTQLGELYLNFGLLGLILGMPLVGGAYRAFGDYLLARRRQAGTLAIYAVMAWPMIAAHEAILAVGVVGAAKTIGLYTIALYAGSRLARRYALAPGRPAAARGVAVGRG